MAKNKEPDKLTLAMRECEKAGFGVHYGAWMAQQEAKYGKREVKQEVEEKVEEEVKKEVKQEKPSKMCEYCGKPFVPKWESHRFCCRECSQRSNYQKHRDERLAYLKEYREKQKAEAETCPQCP